MARGKVHVPPLDSPSKQLMRDLAQQFEQVRLFDLDLKKVHAYERKAFHDELDRKEQELAAQHNAALDEAAAYHDRVREEAEAYLKEHIRQEEEERQRKEEEARKERERIQREKAEKLRREQEEKARIEADRKAKEEAKKKAEREAEQARQAAQAEKDRQERERVEVEKRKQEEEAQKARQEAEQKARSEQQAKVGGTRLTEAEIKVQERYVELHKTLKQVRQWLRNVAKENASAKQAMGDMRRSIKKCVGQLRDGKGTNRQQIAQIKAELEKASSISEPSVDVRKFIAFPPPEIANSEDNKAPALLIYGLNIFAKALISALINEASINPGHAEPVGIIAAQIFSMDAFMYKGIHMSDILWAKYRVVCPALWGFTGNENTDAGRRALGWWRDEAGGPFVSDQTHADRMTALGAGYAALSLRNFGKTQRRNPFPNTMFWISLTKILAIPPGEMQETHVTLLGSMLRSSGERILGFFGQFGLLLMRRAIVDLPEVLPNKTMGVNQLKLLRELYQREKNIDL
ncbi:GLE1-domain-containing protein [Penicillium lagena]|uniref:GLE1-domain-containing protein n=1 Tax=Penicillium lagena TaxID=94218 RepID=UPI00253FE459|nr:GLE1-domain-containing protein [Penicillium lagena]KAJ5620459.1 GLE1-domain-containing protein [Penicillium lagena]